MEFTDKQVAEELVEIAKEIDDVKQRLMRILSKQKTIDNFDYEFGVAQGQSEERSFFSLD